MHYLVEVDHNGMAVHLTSSDMWGGYMKCSLYNAVDGTEDDMLWEGSEEDGNVRSELIS
jgi:hypothetical protein